MKTCGLVLTLVGFATPALAEEVVVFAAASLKTALDVVAADFEAETGHNVVISYAGSNALAKQIIEGAPADIYISAAVNGRPVKTISWNLRRPIICTHVHIRGPQP